MFPPKAIRKQAGSALKYDSNFDRSAKSTATVGLAFYRGRFGAKSLGRNDQATAIVCDRYGAIQFVYTDIVNHWYPAKRHCIDQEVSEAFFENNEFHDLIGVFFNNSRS